MLAFLSVPHLQALEARCYWVKQVISVACGAAFGAMPLVGAMPFAAYVLITGAVTYILTTGDVPTLKEDGRMELFKEGARPAVASFLLLWIVTYTTMHG
jgi:hypothetical protein